MIGAILVFLRCDAKSSFLIFLGWSLLLSNDKKPKLVAFEKDAHSLSPKIVIVSIKNYEKGERYRFVLAIDFKCKNRLKC